MWINVLYYYSNSNFYVLAAAGNLKQPKMQDPAPKLDTNPSQKKVKLPTINKNVTTPKHIVEENGDKPLYYQKAKL